MCYETKRLLWDSKHPDYYNKNKREELWREISQSVNISVKELKKRVTANLSLTVIALRIHHSFHSIKRLTERTKMNINDFPAYASDIEKHWRIKESQRQIFMFASPQLYLRSHLLEWLKNVSEKLRISCRTHHLAVYVLDTFMDKHNIAKDRLGFVALVCLMLAAKFEESEFKIPTIAVLNKYDGFRYSERDFIKVEVLVLKCLDFGLTQPTVAHFVEYYAMCSILPRDLPNTVSSFTQLQELASRQIKQLLDTCLKEVVFLHYPPSQTAAACVLVMRQRMNLSPVWTPELAQLTGYMESNLQAIVTLLNKTSNQEDSLKKKSNISPDHGYVSDSV